MRTSIGRATKDVVLADRWAAARQRLIDTGSGLLCPRPGEPKLEYVPAAATDIRATFERIRRAQEEAAQKPH